MKKYNLTHLAVIACATIAFGASFDAWWHVSKGRDSFFVLPHLFIQLGVFTLLFISYYGWRKLGKPEWKKIFWWIFLVPVSLPFDEMWHRFRGKESVESILIVWSPPHVVLFVGAIGALFAVSHMIKKEKDLVARELFGSLIIAGLLNLCFILSGPFFPFSPFAVIGFYGAAVTSFLLVYMFIHAHRVLPSIFPAVLVALFSTALQMVFSDSNVAFGTRAAGSYPYIPNWIVLFSQIAPAALVDFMPKKRMWLTGGLAGLIFGLILYWLSFTFIDSSFNPGGAAMIAGVLSSGVGGLLAGLWHSKYKALT